MHLTLASLCHLIPFIYYCYCSKALLKEGREGRKEIGEER